MRARMRPFRLLAGLLAALALPTAPALAVIGGQPAPAERGRFTVALVDAAVGRKTVAAGQFCGAVLVRPDALITAGHCAQDESGGALRPASVAVFAGHVLPLRTGRLAAVRSVTVNPGYDDGAGQANADLAVLRLRTPLVGVAPIELATAADASLWQPGVPLGLWGWGNRAAGDGQNFPRQLQDGTVRRYSDASCDDFYGRYFNPASQLCAGVPDGTTDACQGDSGGPLTATRPDGVEVLVGVVSYGEGCGQPQFPTVYTKLSRYRTFLARALAPLPGRRERTR
jgi:trypsin